MRRAPGNPAGPPARPTGARVLPLRRRPCHHAAMTSRVAHTRPARHLLWAGLVAAAVVLADRPGDPGPVPTGWVVVLAVLGVLSGRGSTAAWAVLVTLNAVLLATVALLAWPVDGSLRAFYALVAAALVVLLAARRSPAAAGRPAPAHRVS